MTNKKESKLIKFRRRLKLFRSVKWFKTLYFNFKIFPFAIAKKLPVCFYERVKFSNLDGKIILKAPIKTGMIGFGQKFEKFSRSRGTAELYLCGDIEFNGHAHFGKDVFLYVDKHAKCEFGHMACLGSNVKLVCTNKITLGNWAGIGYESQLSDSNYHPMKNTETNEYYEMSKPIEIGNHNAFSNRITILPGTKTPEHCVVASNSVCNTDYNSLGSNILIGGVPAKLIKENYARDWEAEKENLKKAKMIW